MSRGTVHATVGEFECEGTVYTLPATLEDPADEGVEDIKVVRRGEELDYEELSPRDQERIEAALWEAARSEC